MSLFGNLSNQGSATNAGSNLFGGAGASSSGASQAETTATGSGGGGLFGSFPKPATTTQGGLFGAAATTGGGGLFGNMGTQTTSAPAGGLFGSGPAATTQPTATSFFAQSVPPLDKTQSLFETKPAQGLQQDKTDAEKGQTAYFNSLLEKNKKRLREDEKSGYGGMPKIELGLGDISRRVRELGGVGGAAKGDRTADSKAHYLLAASGVNPGTTLRDLNSFSPAGGAPLSQNAASEWDPDNRKFVEELQQQTTLKMIAEGIERAHRNFDAYLEDHVEMNWAEQRKKVYEHFGLATRGFDGDADGLNGGTSTFRPGATGSFGRSAKRSRANGANTSTNSALGASAMHKSVIGTPSRNSSSNLLFGESADKGGPVQPFADDRWIAEKESRFSEKVQRLNESRLSDKDTYQIFHEFNKVESYDQGATPPEIKDAYKALIEIVGEGKDGKKIKQRQFKDDYLDEAPNSARVSTIRKRILDGSRRALEMKFFEQIRDTVAKNPKEAIAGGTPGIIDQIRGYINVKRDRKTLTMVEGLDLQDINGDAAWALIFYLLRSGHVREAAKYVADNKQAFQALDRNFVTYISSYVNSPEQRLARPQQDKINAEYQQRMRMAPENSLDPYRMACYKVIGRCEMGKRSIDTINQDVDDWIWLQFALARETNRVNEVATEAYGLDDVRETIREIGQRHFSRGSDSAPQAYGTYFYLQILGGLFESAVAFLYSHSYVSAVHFAIALDYYGLLRVSDFSASESELLTYTTKDQSQVNFGRMLGYYTRDFRAANAIAATDYLTLIYLDADLHGQIGRSQAQLCHEAIRELILETREFAQLLGDIQFDGSRIKGAIELRQPLIGITQRDDFLRTVTMQAAAVADDSGRTTDAVLLYHLSDDYDTVMTTINRALSDACAVDIGAEPLRIDPVKPRDVTQASGNASKSSFSLTAVDDPAVLARNFEELYGRQALFYQKIRPANRDVCRLLINISAARSHIENSSWPPALDIIAGLDMLPLNAKGSIPAIRAAAQNVGSLPPTVSRLVGPLLLWTITAIGRQREILLGPDENGIAFDSDTKAAMRSELVNKAKDVMTFAGLVQFRLPKGVWDGVTLGAGEMGVY